MDATRVAMDASGAPAASARAIDPAAQRAAGVGAKRDWVFTAFVAFALGMSLFTGVNRFRLDRALNRGALCLARADTACAGRALEDARAVDAKHPRVALLGVGLDILLGDGMRAATAVEAIERGSEADTLGAVARGELLLVRGDLDRARGANQQARDRYAAAKLLVRDPALVTDRLDRLDREEAGRASEIADITSSFDRLFLLAAGGDTDGVAGVAEDLSDRIAKVAHAAARSKMSAAKDLVVRVARAARAGVDVELAADPPSRPTWRRGDEDPNRPSPEMTELEQQRALAEYERRVARSQDQGRTLDAWREQRSRARRTSVEGGLAQARRLLADALQMLDRSRPQ